MTILADSGWAHVAQWTVVVIAIGLMIAVAVSSEAIRRHDRKGWFGIGAVVLVLGLGVLLSYPTTVSPSPTPPSLVSHNP